MSPSLWQTTPTKKKQKKKLHVSPGDHKKATRRNPKQSQQTDSEKKKLRARGRAKLGAFSVAATLFSSGETLSGARFSFCGSPHVAHPCCLRTLLLHVQSGWSQREGFNEDHRPSLDGWFRRKISLPPPPPLSLSLPHSPPLAIPCLPRTADLMHWQPHWHSCGYGVPLSSTKPNNFTS